MSKYIPIKILKNNSVLEVGVVDAKNSSQFSKAEMKWGNQKAFRLRNGKDKIVILQPKFI